MDYIFNKEKIKQALSDFYNSTGIAVALYDASGKGVAGSPAHSPYCRHIRSREECIEHCSQSNQIHIKEVFSTRQIRRYSCHAGLMETIMPVIYEGVLIAYIQIGQFRDAEETYSSRERLSAVAEQYGFERDRLEALYGDLPVVSEEKLLSLYHVVDILIKSFWMDGLITRNRSMLSVRIEQYITAHLSEQIYIGDLSHEFFLSRNAIYQLFSEEFHTTVNAFITQKRLQRAKELLLSHPEMNVTEISVSCGFPDYNYFIRLFKKQVGLTPLQFRKAQSAR